MRFGGMATKPRASAFAFLSLRARQSGAQQFGSNYGPVSVRIRSVKCSKTWSNGFPNWLSTMRSGRALASWPTAAARQANARQQAISSLQRALVITTWNWKPRMRTLIF